MSWVCPIQSKNKLDLNQSLWQGPQFLLEMCWQLKYRKEEKKKKKGLNINTKLNDVENNTLACEVHFSV